MKAHILDMPDEGTEILAWLERQFVADQFLEVVAEFQALAVTSGGSTSLEEVLADQREAVLAHGLAALNDAQLSALLAQPRLLIELQELIFTEGGAYWNKHLASQDLTTQAAQALPEILKQLEAAKVTPAEVRKHGSIRRIVLISVISLAALLLITIGFLRPAAEQQIAWGWARPGAFDGPTTRTAYLQQLATGAEGWFKQRPADKASVQMRIEEFRVGCEQLLVAEHQPLPAKDKAWLLERCRAWLAKIDQHLANLKADDKSPSDVRSDMDATVQKLISALNERAELL